jgi:hypothetical protein
MKHILDSVRPSITAIHALALALAVTGGVVPSPEGRTPQLDDSNARLFMRSRDIRLHGTRRIIFP